MTKISISFNDNSAVETMISDMGTNIYKLVEHRKKLSGMQTDLEQELKLLMEESKIYQLASNNLRIALAPPSSLRGVNRDRFDAVLEKWRGAIDSELLAELEACYYQLGIPAAVVVYNSTDFEKELTNGTI
jgi:hypothetical protein